jgi:hypothetical protein
MVQELKSSTRYYNIGIKLNWREKEYLLKYISQYRCNTNSIKTNIGFDPTFTKLFLVVSMIIKKKSSDYLSSR